MSPNSRLTWRGLAGFMGFFAGLCTIFVLVVTVAEAWQERAQARWPEVMAHVDTCGMDQSSTDSDRYYIDCRLSYTVGAEQIVTSIRSRNVSSPQIWQYPANQIQPFEEWVDAHPPGTPLAVHYDPLDHKRAVLVVTDMPRGGPRAATDLKLLGVFATTCIVLLTIARIARPRSA